MLKDRLDVGIALYKQGFVPKILLSGDNGQEGHNGIHVKKLYLPDVGENSRTEAYEALVTEAATAGVPVGYIHKGQALSEKEFTLFCLHPETGDESREPNEYSTVLLLCFQDFRASTSPDFSPVTVFT